MGLIKDFIKDLQRKWLAEWILAATDRHSRSRAHVIFSEFSGVKDRSSVIVEHCCNEIQLNMNIFAPNEKRTIISISTASTNPDPQSKYTTDNLPNFRSPFILAINTPCVSVSSSSKEQQQSVTRSYPSRPVSTPLPRLSRP